MSDRLPRTALVCAIAAVVCAVTAAQPALPTVIRAPAAFLLAFVLPGMVLTRSFVGFMRMGRVERLTWVFGTSIAVVVLAGLGIAAVGAALAPGTWAVVLAGVTLTGAALAAIRRVPGATRRTAGIPRISGLSVALVAGALVLTAVAVGYVRQDAAQRDQPTATQLWAIPSSASVVRIGVRSHEPAASSFRVSVDGADGGPREWQVRLEPGQEWEMEIPVSDAQGPLRARLYGSDAPEEILREVVIWPPSGAS